jgi:hypothetical protein
MVGYANEIHLPKGLCMSIFMYNLVAGVIAGGVLSTAIAMITQKITNSHGLLVGIVVWVLAIVVATTRTTNGHAWGYLLIASVIPWLVVALLSPELVALPGRYLDYAWLFPHYDTAAINNLEQWITAVAIPLAVLCGVAGWWSWGK